MNAKQMKFAVKIYMLSLTYHGMGRAGDSNSTEEELALIEETGQECLRRLNRLGYGSELASITKCIEAAKEKYPNKKNAEVKA